MLLMGNSFEDYIKQTITDKFGDISQEIIEKSYLLQYIIKKTKPADKNESKARKGLGTLYAIYVLIQDYVERGYFDGDNKGKYNKYEGARDSVLSEKAKKKEFGQKLQNHYFNNRTNEEFFGLFPLQREKDVKPIVHMKKRYWINEQYLIIPTSKKEVNISCQLLDIIDHYTEVIKEKLDKFISDCTALQNIETSDKNKVIDFIESLIAPDVDARLFEIVSYSILKYYYYDRKIYWGFSREELNEDHLRLYKTGRTNANDGGIDFVMQPLGTFFQVTETMDFKKYFLDIDKIERYPITFVIKSSESEDEIREILRKDAMNTYGVDAVVDEYMKCIEKIINIPELKSFLIELNTNGKVPEILNEMIIQSKVEFNYEDLSEND